MIIYIPQEIVDDGDTTANLWPIFETAVRDYGMEIGSVKRFVIFGYQTTGIIRLNLDGILFDLLDAAANSPLFVPWDGDLPGFVTVTSDDTGDGIRVTLGIEFEPRQK